MILRGRIAIGAALGATFVSAFAAEVAHAQARSDATLDDDEEEVVSTSAENRHGPRRLHVEAGLRGGVAIGFTGLEVGPLAGAEFAIRRTLGPVEGVIQLRAAYESHTMSGSGDASCRTIPPSSPCVSPDIGRYDYTLVERELQSGLAVGYRIRRWHERWTPYGMLAMAIVWQRVESTAYGFTQIEARHSYALGLAIGVQYEFHFLAPFVEAELRYAPIAAAQTGVSQVSTVHIDAGIRVVF